MGGHPASTVGWLMSILVGLVAAALLAGWWFMWRPRGGRRGSVRPLRIAAGVAVAALGLTLMASLCAGWAEFSISRTQQAARAPVEEALADLAAFLQSGPGSGALQGRVEETARRFNLTLVVANEEGMIIAGYPQNLVGQQMRGEILRALLSSRGTQLEAYGIDTNSGMKIRAYGLPVSAEATGVARWVPSLFHLLARVFFVTYWLALAAWVYLDARRWTDRAVGLGVLVLLTNAVGWAAYMAIRHRGSDYCPACGQPLRSMFKVCPRCGAAVRRSCPVCGQVVEEPWAFCPYCGKGLGRT